MTTELAERLVRLTTPCSECRGDGNVEERAYPPGKAVTTCSVCHGTGRVPLLPGVRVKCNQIHNKAGCPGFTASDSPEAWLRAWRELTGGRPLFIQDEDIMETLVKAIADLPQLKQAMKEEKS